MSNLFDLLTYRSYAHNRLESPEVSPERWARIFPNAAAMEKRFVREFEAALMQSTTGILDVADHTISTAENQPFKGGTTVGSSGEATATASPLQILPEPFTLQQTGATASTSLSVVPENFSCFIERIDEFVAVRLPRIADCFCGRPSVHECPCGEPICANHSYDSLCGTCTEAKQLQQSSVMDGADRYEGAR